MIRTAESALPRRARKLDRPAGLWSQVPGRLLHHPVALGGLLVILAAIAVAAWAPGVAPHDPTEMFVAAQRLPPAWVRGPSPATSGDPRFPLGTDVEGRDVLSRVLYGLRPALVLGIVGAVSAALLGTLLGMLAAYAEHRAGRALMILAEAISSLPVLMSFVLLYRVLVFSDLAPILGRTGVVVLPFALVQWVSAARVVHARVLTVKQELYVEAARSIGAGHGRILLRHIFPACVNLVTAWTAITVPQLIVLEAVLGYLGTGVYVTGDEAGLELFTITWGKIMESGRKMLFTGPMQVLAPTLAITVLAMAFTFLGDGLRRAFDPQTSRR